MSISISKIKREWNKIKKPSKFREWLESIGMRQIGSGAFSDVYSHRSLDFVVKVIQHNSKKIEYPRTNDHPLFWSFLHPIYVPRSRKIMVQQKVSRRQLERAQRNIVKQYDYAKEVDIECTFDVHYENVGWLNDTPVIIDCGYEVSS